MFGEVFLQNTSSQIFLIEENLPLLISFVCLRYIKHASNLKGFV